MMRNERIEEEGGEETHVILLFIGHISMPMGSTRSNRLLCSKTYAKTHRSGDADLIASDDDDLLAGEELLGHDRGQAAQEVIASVDYNGFGHGCWLGGFD